jgi:rhodanese-related sulfurtransferase
MNSSLSRWLAVFVLASSMAACNSDAPSDGADNSAAGPTAAPTLDATLFGEDQLVPAAEIKAAVDSGADILFVDARAPLNYEAEHIAGAVNAPYYDAAQYVNELPKDRWIVTYCECPTAEATQLADELTAAGFSHVRVIEEGLQGWRDQGGALEAGAATDA